LASIANFIARYNLIAENTNRLLLIGRACFLYILSDNLHAENITQHKPKAKSDKVDTDCDAMFTETLQTVLKASNGQNPLLQYQKECIRPGQG
jgi:hypothetical protein